MSAEQATPLGSRIRALRKEHGLSAQKLADLTADAGVTRNIIADIENGRKKNLEVTQAIAIAHLFDMSVEQLVDMSIPAAAWAACLEIWKARCRLDKALTDAEVDA